MKLKVKNIINLSELAISRGEPVNYARPTLSFVRIRLTLTPILINI